MLSGKIGLVWNLKIVGRRYLYDGAVLLTMMSLILNTKPKSTVEAADDTLF